jgi:hypothetical protein
MVETDDFSQLFGQNSCQLFRLPTNG